MCHYLAVRARRLLPLAMALAAVACSPGGRSGDAQPPVSSSPAPSRPSPDVGAVTAARVVAVRPERLARRGWGHGPAAFGRYTTGAGGTAVPSAVLATDDGLLVLDAVNARLVRFRADGTYAGDVALPVRRRDAVLVTAAAYDTADGTAYVLDAARGRLLAARGTSVTAVPVALPVRQGAVLSGVPLVVPSPGVVCGQRPDGPLPFLADGRPSDDATRCAGLAAVSLDGRVAEVAGRRVRLPGDLVLDAQPVPSPDGAAWLFANVARGERIETYVVRADAGGAAAVRVAFSPPGDVVQPVAVVPGGFVLLTGDGDGMSLLRYALP
jgi:hypothetical protein